MDRVTHAHQMPFGAEMLDDDAVRFRLWAPAAKRVDLCLYHRNSQITLPMKAEPQGWFGTTTNLAEAGTRYRYCIDGEREVPDPASRYQPEGVHGVSEVIDAKAWQWRMKDWRGRSWHEAVIYELHIGTFSAQGSYAAVQGRLDYLVELGVTAIQLMPVAESPGKRNWGYDGAYLFAPEQSYGKPEDLKALIDAAHERGLMVILDVVYNHFGPEGNYLHLYAPYFFSDHHKTLWGAAINYDGEASRWVRQFFINNALYWLEEYQLDGLRLDAVHSIFDDSQRDILTELAESVRDCFVDQRHIHLLLENDNNAASYLERDRSGGTRWYEAQWNDDLHHALHLLLTGESDGYYEDYVDDPLNHLGRALTEGFAYQGESSRFRNNSTRGQVSRHLPLTAFISFLQNHDQIGNRAFGERISTLITEEQLRAATALLLLAPSPPLLFMGQEWVSRHPFLYFCDFNGDLAKSVVDGRRQEFSRQHQFTDHVVRARIPDPSAEQTFAQSQLDWSSRKSAEGREWLELHRSLLSLRKRVIAPRLPQMEVAKHRYRVLGERALEVLWQMGGDEELLLIANLGDEADGNIDLPNMKALYATHDVTVGSPLPPWSLLWYLSTDHQSAFGAFASKE